MTAAISGDVMRFGDGATEAVGVSLSRALTEEVVPAVAVVQAAVSVTSVTTTFRFGLGNIHRLLHATERRGHNGQFYIKSRKIIFTGPKLASYSFY